MKKWESDLADLLRKISEKEVLAPQKIKALEKERDDFIDRVAEPAFYDIETALKKGRFNLMRDRENKEVYATDVIKMGKTDPLFCFDLRFDFADDILRVKLGSEREFRVAAEVDQEILCSVFIEQMKSAIENPEKAVRRRKIHFI